MHRTTDHKSSTKRIFKSIASPFCGGERGFSSFIFVLVLLVLGSIVIVPLLGYMITGTKSGATYEKKTTEFYSADAGVEYAIFWLQHGLLDALTDESVVDITDSPWKDPPGPLLVNNDNVTVTVQNETGEVGGVYRIVSTARDNTPPYSTTTVVSRVRPDIDFVGDFFNKAMMSDGYINLKNASNTTINGDIKVRGLIELSSGVVVNGNVVCDNMTNKGTINGNVVCSDRLENTGYISGDVWCKTLVNGGGEIGGKADCGSVVSEGDVGSGPFIEDPPPPVDMSKDWPEVGDLDGYYDDGLPILGIPVIKKEMNVTGPQSLGPGKTGNFVAGVRPPDGTAVGLVIDCPNQTDVVKLTGTVLVTGDLALNKGTLNLNGQTIYVRGVVTTKPPDFTVTGSGIIIALGDVYFAPNIEAGGVGDASVILHYNGTTWTTDTGGIDRNLDLSRAVLNDVWGTASNVYAVGDAGTILKYSGAAWSKQDITSVLPLSASLNLNGVWGSSSDNVFVVGDQGTILRWNGSLWQIIAGGSGQPDLRGIWGDPSGGIFAVGDEGTILYSPDGLTWEEISTGRTTLEDELWDVHGIVDGSDVVELFVVGTKGTILHSYGDFLDPDSWTRVPPPTAPTVMDLKGVWGFKDGDVTTFYVVGAAAGLYTKTSTILEYIDDDSNGSGAWEPGVFSNVSTGDLNDVWGIQSDFDGTMKPYAFTVGQDGTILRSIDGGDWTPMGNSSKRSLNGVWGLSPTNIFAVGLPKNDFVFVMSAYGKTNLQPGNTFYGTVAGSSESWLKSGSTLQAPMGTGGMNYPRIMFMRLETYVIR